MLSQYTLLVFCVASEYPCDHSANAVGNWSGYRIEESYLEAVQAKKLERRCANVPCVISHMFPHVLSDDVH